jgi:hypothetical protein
MFLGAGRGSVNVSFLSGENDRIPCVRDEECDNNTERQRRARRRVHDVHNCFRWGGVNDAFHFDLVLGPYIRVVLKVCQFLACDSDDVVYYFGTFLRA